MALEALVAGRPVVATRTGAIPEVLTDGSEALLVPPEDPVAIAEAVIRLVEEKDTAERLVRDGRRRVRDHYTEEAAADAFMRLVAAVLET